MLMISQPWRTASCWANWDLPLAVGPSRTLAMTFMKDSRMCGNGRALASSGHVQDRASGVGRLVRQQPQDGTRHLFGFTAALHRDAGAQALDAIGFARAGVDAGIDEAGPHAIDADAVLGQLLGEAERHRVDGALGAGVVDPLAG